MSFLENFEESRAVPFDDEIRTSFTKEYRKLGKDLSVLEKRSGMAGQRYREVKRLAETPSRLPGCPRLKSEFSYLFLIGLEKDKGTKVFRNFFEPSSEKESFWNLEPLVRPSQHHV